MKSLHLICACGGGHEPPAIFLAELYDTVRKYLTQFDDKNNMMAALSIVENKVYGIHETANKQQLQWICGRSELGHAVL